MTKFQIDPEFSALFPINRETVEAIKADGEIREPLIVWRGLLLDGHTRYAAAQEARLSYRVEEVSLPDRAAALRWMYTRQVLTRRNLSPDQLMIVQIRGGLPTKGGMSDRKARALIEHAPAEADAVFRGVRSITAAHNNAIRAGLIAAPVRAPRGPASAPTTPHVPAGHEVRGVSTRTNAEGEVETQWTKTGLQGGEPEELPPDFLVKKRSTMYAADGTVRVQWESAEKEKADQWAQFIAATEAHCAQYRGLASPLPSPVDTQRTLTVYPLGDPHAGMMSWAAETGESHDLQIWRDRLYAAMDLAIASTPASEDAWIVNLGDALHAQTAEQRTPRGGHKLDVDGRQGKVFQVFFDVCRRVTDRALAKHARVRWFSIPGNHDPEVSFMIASWLRAVYEREPRVEVNSGLRPYVYEAFGNSLIGMAHGDGAKPEALPGIMANDVPELWGRSRFRTWYTGHVHHQTRKDFTGCSVESFRILPPADYWHHHKGYRAARAQHTITIHPEFGEILRGTVDLSLIESVLKKHGEDHA